MLMKTLRVVSIFFIVILIQARPAASAGMRDSVVKIFVTANPMDYYRPWQSKGSYSSSGSGCVIAGNRILTNAHVVADETFIQIRKESDPNKYTAKVVAIGHDCDLAVLSVDDPAFFDGLTPLEFGELPQLQDAVTVLGFPQGGDKLSITEGVVSRIEIIPYTQSSKQLLAVQIDAAINPGNSGGPVFKDGRIVGIAMQGMTSGQNIGYMIPMPIIQHFFDDLSDNQRYEGFPSLGIEYDNTENKALREFYKLHNQTGGVLISRVIPFSPSYGILRDGDVLLTIDGVPIGPDGTVEFQEQERMSFSYLVHRKQLGETIALEVSRDGQRIKKEVLLTPYTALVPEPHRFEKPSYYIYGGLVFSILSVDLLKAWGKEWWEKAPLDFMYYLVGKGRLNLQERREIVVLLDILPDDRNVGYHQYRNEVITRVNGHDIHSFAEFVQALEKNSGRYTNLETDKMCHIILDNQDIDDVTARILERNHVPARYSPDVAQGPGPGSGSPAHP